MGGSSQRIEPELQKIILSILHPNPKISMRVRVLSPTSEILRQHQLPINNTFNSTTVK